MLRLVPIVLIQSNEVNSVVFSDLGKRIETLSVEDERDTDTDTSESSCASYTVEVSFWVRGIIGTALHGDIVIDDHGDRGHVDTPCKNICGDENLGLSSTELLEDVIAIIAVERTVDSNDFVAVSSQTIGNSACSLSFLQM